MAEPLQDEGLTAEDRLWILGDHPALNFLNTVEPVNGKLMDTLKSGKDVLRWLDQAGWPSIEASAHPVPPRLLKAARMLREEIRTLVEKRENG